MQLPKELVEIILDYMSQLQGVEFKQSLAQHLRSLNMLEELMFVHRNYTTFALEFHGHPPKVIRNLSKIRGNNDPQEWSDRFLQMTAQYQHPKIEAILLQFCGISLLTL